ncbi:tRNA (N(6)-L-threonylcarbamoyladenosine(37)-C(2))-methylthiotransferase MtaB [Hippea alviniae]|uniref:tRNA (N(6)-L-threonylcarbamoyladenosine(37)-C(2))- methylthiotransferase MtaB n=1 Tax=Hippea alviniae TaxID=1279027 RepID=UPI0003B45DD7|nr:tRNA (N(6)-L-threonylcarbamoyladenosine(37)-C(2))-methylthiotransferase MtaB [Hippea alviniae]
MRVALATFGCKLNQYETQQMIQQLTEKGFEIGSIDEPCDFYIINSCAVTSKASKESRMLAKRLSKIGKVIYTGCDSYLEERLKSQFILVGNSYKTRIVEVIESGISDISEDTKNYPLNETLNQYFEKSRAFIKIQEGCNNHCTYCIIPKLRGKERDKDQNLIIKEINNLKEKFPEIVLTGTNIGSYKNFKGLLKRIDSIAGDFRIRISSIEPMYVDKELIDIIASGRFAKHLHIPLQSGSDKILKLMGRDYKTEDYKKIVEYCHKKDIFVGTDVIVGFFNETEEEFDKTYKFIEELPLSFGHVFSYSKRPFTAAANIKGYLPKGPTVKERNRILRELFAKKRRESMLSKVRSECEIVIESTKVKRKNRQFFKAISSWYFPVLVEKYKKGVVKGIIESADDSFAYLK